MSEQSSGPAFPCQTTEWNPDRQEWQPGSYGGMTLRDYFAAKAMQGMQANIGANKWETGKFAENAYLVADAMMKAREA